jgi:capsular polysaccharide biosynthesis protein
MELDLKGILRVLRKRLWMIIALVVVVGMVTAYYSYAYMKPVYEASTKIIVNKTRVVEGVQELSIQDLNASIQLIATYKEVIKSPWIMNDVVQSHAEFGLTTKDLMDKIAISSVNETQVMTVTATDGSYRKAAQIVNAVTEQFVSKIPDLYQVNNVTILNPADESDSPGPVKPSPQMNIIVAVILSFLLGIGITFLMEYMDDSLRTEEDIQDYLDLPTLAVITRMNKQDYLSKKNKWHTKSEKVGDSHVATNQ